MRKGQLSEKLVIHNLLKYMEMTFDKKVKWTYVNGHVVFRVFAVKALHEERMKKIADMLTVFILTELKSHYSRGLTKQVKYLQAFDAISIEIPVSEEAMDYAARSFRELKDIGTQTL